EGWLNSSGPSPVTPAFPSASSSFPSRLNLKTWCPFPSRPRASVTQTFPSRSTSMPWGKTNTPAAKLFLSRPDSSNSRTAGRLEPAQVLAPHLSATQMDRPSGATSTALVAPQVRPSGIFAQPSTVRYGLPGELAAGVSARVPESAAAATTAPSSVGHARRARLRANIFATASSALLHQPDVGDRHRLVRGLDHVVDGQPGHGDGVQRLHLCPRAGLRPDAGLDLEAVPAGPHVDVDEREGQRVTRRNRLC